MVWIRCGLERPRSPVAVFCCIFFLQMAYRGRGRGRGRCPGRFGSFDNRMAKHEPYILFPEDVKLPSVPNVKTMSAEEKGVILCKMKLESFWAESCYHLQETATKSKRQHADLELSSYGQKRRTPAKPEALASYLKLSSSNFPPELIQGLKRVQHLNKKLRWDGNSGEQKLEMFENLEERFKGQGEQDKEKKGESEDEEEAEEEAEEESSDDGDYNQNIDFDDDEDDLNMEEEKDEDYYE